LSTVLARAAQAAGLLAKVTIHDLRRDAARDVANFKDRQSGAASWEVAQSLGHSRKAFEEGTMDDYVGDNQADCWSQRIRKPFHNGFGIQIADARYEATANLTSKEIDQLCVEKRFDASSLSKRSVVARDFKRSHYAA